MKTNQRRSQNWYCLICLASKSYNVTQDPAPSNTNPKLFPMPTTKLDLHRWKKQIRDFIPPSDNGLDDAAICSIHFADDDFDKYTNLPGVDCLMGNTIPFVSNELIDAVACERSRKALKPKCHFPNIAMNETPFMSTDLCLDLEHICRICLLDVGDNERQLTDQDRAKIAEAGLKLVETASLSNKICQGCSKDLAGDLTDNVAFRMNLNACNELAPHLASNQQLSVGEYQMMVVGKPQNPDFLFDDDEYSDDDNDGVPINMPPPKQEAKPKKRYFYYCHHCPKTYGEKHMLLLHLLNKHFQDKKQKLDQQPNFQCEMCEKSFAFAPELRAHRKSDHPQTNRRCFPKLKPSAQSKELPKVQCPICERLVVQYSLRTHIRSVHKRTNDHHCEVCDKSFFRRKYLDDHIMSSHPELLDPDTEEVSCHYCEYKTKNMLRYKRHVLQLHPEVRERPFGCGVCSKEFVFADSLSRHQRAQHSKGGLYTCEECGKVLRTSVSITAHKRMHEKMREMLGDWRDYIIS